MTVGELFASNGLQPCGPVAWGIPVQCDLPGVYVVALNSDPAWQSGLPVPEELPAEMRRRWLDDQPILYIGKAGGPGYKSVLGKRLGQFYRHCYGKRSPHSRGLRSDNQDDLPSRLSRYRRAIREAPDPATLGILGCNRERSA